MTTLDFIWQLKSLGWEDDFIHDFLIANGHESEIDNEKNTDNEKLPTELVPYP